MRLRPPPHPRRRHPRPRPCAAAPSTAFVLGSALLLALALALALGALSAAPDLHAQSLGPTAADLVVDLDDGRVLTRRLPVEQELSGLEVLEAAGVDAVTNGGAVCAIGGVGCPAADCFCACASPDQDCRYWAYFRGREDGGWDYAEQGPAESLVVAGGLEGWAWGGGRPPVTATARSRAVWLGAGWLAGQRLEDGGFGAPGLTIEGLMANRAAGRPEGERSALLTALEAGAEDYGLTSAAAAGKLLAGLVAAGADPRDHGGLDHVARLEAWYKGEGRYGASVWDQSWALLGLAAAREEIPLAARLALSGQRAADGGWGFAPGAEESDTDSTAIALQALAAAGAPPEDEAVTAGRAWLEAERNAAGGWGHDDAGSVNANSTAYALQALVGLGEDPFGAPWTQDGLGPVDALLAAQRDEGRFAYDDFPADLVATLQVLPALAGRTLAPAGEGVAARDALAWMRAQQQQDGSFEGFNPGATVDAVLALYALGEPADVARPGGASSADYLAAQAPAYADSGPAAAGKLCAGAVALGRDPRDFGGVDLVARIAAGLDPATGRYGSSTWDQAWAILGLVAAGEPLPPDAVIGLLFIGAEGGGWGFDAAAEAADVDSTALALQALAAAGVGPDQPDLRAGLAFLRAAQRPDGGFPGFDGATAASSTGLALAGLRAAGQRPEEAGWMRADDRDAALSVARTPVDALLALQSPQGGFAGFGGANDPAATYAALLGLSGQSLPPRPAPVLYLPMTLRSP